jgi:hypothetical protein
MKWTVETNHNSCSRYVICFAYSSKLLGLPLVEMTKKEFWLMKINFYFQDETVEFDLKNWNNATERKPNHLFVSDVSKKNWVQLSFDTYTQYLKKIKI